MRICQIELRNFRGIRKGTVVLPKHAVLLGANNAGKSTIVEALALLFAREKMVRPTSDWDFFGGRPTPSSRFYIIGTITDFPHDDPSQLHEWFLGSSAARPLWWDDGQSKLCTDVDQPKGTRLATQVALAAKYDEEISEFEKIRYFYYGESDPFIDEYSSVPQNLLRDIGLFLLSSNREWDKLLSFSSSSLLKVLREHKAVPGVAIEELKQELRAKVKKIEEAAPLSAILETAEKELQSFLLIKQSSKIAYRPTSLDTMSVLQSLVAHIGESDDSLIPVAKHGAGTVSLQAFLLLLAFAEQRRIAGRNFILAAEEPELHLHPSLHQRLIHRIRSASLQSVVTTQSPQVASGYQPHEAIFVQNRNGELVAEPLRREPVKTIQTNSIRNLYLVNRSAYYEALMGGVILVPEGIYDYDWLCLWQRVAQSCPEAVVVDYDLRPITIVPTSDAAIVATYAEVAKFRPDVLPIIDGDAPGDSYLKDLQGLSPSPRRMIRLGGDAAIECLAAWILEPSLVKPGKTLSELLPNFADRTLKRLQQRLFETTNKKSRELREQLAWEALDSIDCCKRACEFFHDIAAIAVGDTCKNTSWIEKVLANGSTVVTANHVQRV